MINFIVKLVTSTIIGVLVMSCSFKIDSGNAVTGSGNVITEKRTVDPFDKIEVSNGLECIIQQSDKTQVSVEADDNLQDGIKTSVENGVLIISSEFDNYKNVKSKKIFVQVPKITSIKSNSAAVVKSANVLTGEVLQIESSSASSVNINVEMDKITLNSSSASQLKLNGKALILYTDSSSASIIDAKGLLVNEVHSDASSASSTTVRPLVSVEADASSASTINYIGTPKNISAKESSGARVRKTN